jgi:hypothetical protein
MISKILVSALLLTAGTNALATITVELAQELMSEVVPEVERLRGLTFEHAVPVRVVSDDEARTHLMERLELFDVPARMQIMQRAYRHLGLLPDDVDVLEAFLEALREQAGGYYDPQSKSFFLLDDVPAELIKVLMAHELTHALEDQQYDLDAGLQAVIDDDDQLFALGAVHEGSATLLMTVYTTQQMMQGKMDAETFEDISETEFGGEAALAKLPPVLVRQLLGPYVLGMNFLSRELTTLAQGYPQSDVALAYAAGPTSSEQILHPERYWDEAQRDEPVMLAPSTAGDLLGRKWKLQGAGVLGELTIGLLVGAETPLASNAMLAGAAAWTNAAADGWDGDRWELWSRGAAELVVLRTIWDSPEDALEFANALPDRESFDFVRYAHRVVIAAGGSQRTRTSLLKRLTPVP